MLAKLPSRAVAKLLKDSRVLSAVEKDFPPEVSRLPRLRESRTMLALVDPFKEWASMPP
jgi:hypothetical protein